MLNPKVQEKVDLMNILFCSRTDVYAKLWQQKEGSIGYSPEYLPDGSSKPLADTDILSHLLVQTFFWYQRVWAGQWWQKCLRKCWR